MPSASVSTSPPGDVEAWARQYVLGSELSLKLAPPPPPERFAEHAIPHRLERPGRPPELKAAARGERTPKPEALREPRHRARVLHTFFHHELQAAELMCWAILAFSDAELEFRQGLLRVCLDEIRHMNLYREHIERLGFALGDFGVRDWFWQRVPSCPTKVSFVALMGMGFEAANLEHAPTFAARFEAASDHAGAELQRRIAREELAHVRFATRWFTRWTGACDFERWRAELPAPLSPWLMRGETLDAAARGRAGMPSAFIAALRAFVPGKDEG